MSLANKYRPQTFDAMIGQEHIIDILKAQMLARETVHHNYLLFWPRGTGKTTSARLIAKGLNCTNLQNGNPCNQCAHCQLINTGTSLDYVEIDAASHTGVDNIREEIIDRALYPPTALYKKIYVIDEVHMLSKGAFNALLKTIEEPKNNVCFILATTEIHKVPDTIISRCQVFNYRKVAPQAMVAHLEAICKAEQLSYTRPALEIIATISEGHVRDAVKYIDQVSILWTLDEENITKFLGVAGDATIDMLLQTIKSKDRNQIFLALDQISQGGVDLSVFAKQIIGYIDQHLMEDTDFLLEMCKVFGEIISTLRWYPYPIVAYKIGINSYLSSESVVSSEASQQASQHLIVSSSVGQGVVESGGEAVVSTSSVSTVPQEDASPIWAQPQQSSQVSTTSSVLDFKSLWTQVVAKLWKPTVQSNLKDQAIIETKEGNQITVVVITKIAEMLLNNEENKKALEQFLSQELGESIEIRVSYEDKASYFARKMGL